MTIPNDSLAEKALVWIDPDTIKDLEKHCQTVAVTGEVAHKLMNWQAFHSAGLEHIDGKEWEMFNTSHKGTHQGQEYVWGMFLEGIGAFNVMVPIDRTRRLTDAERAFWTGRHMVMVGSHSGKVSYGFTAHVTPEVEA